MVSPSDLLAFVDAKRAYEIDVVAASRAQTDGADSSGRGYTAMV